MAQQENTVKTVRLSVAYQNEYGRILWNKEWRIFTVEVVGEDDERRENIKQLIDILHEEINDFHQIVIDDPENDQANNAFIRRYEVLLFMADPDTHLIMNQGEWNSQRVAIRTMAENILRDVLKEHPEMINHIPPELRHRFK